MEIILKFVLLVLALSMFIAAMSLAPWVPTPGKHLKRAIDLAKIKPGERFYDLGCGDGRTVVYAAKQFSANATGIELAFPLYVAAKIRVLLSRASHAEIKLGNIFKHDLSDADVIYVYGMPSVLAKRLRSKLEQECKPGTRVISLMFEIQGWQPTATEISPSRRRNKDVPIMLYVL